MLGVGRHDRACAGGVALERARAGIDHPAGQLVHFQSHDLAWAQSLDVGIVHQQHRGELFRVADEADERTGLDQCSAIGGLEQ